MGDGGRSGRARTSARWCDAQRTALGVDSDAMVLVWSRAAWWEREGAVVTMAPWPSSARSSCPRARPQPAWARMPAAWSLVEPGFELLHRLLLALEGCSPRSLRPLAPLAASARARDTSSVGKVLRQLYSSVRSVCQLEPGGRSMRVVLAAAVRPSDSPLLLSLAACQARLARATLRCVRRRERYCFLSSRASGDRQSGSGAQQEGRERERERGAGDLTTLNRA